MLKLAITGGLSSGKSTVSALLRERGCPVVDADRLGHELLQTEAHDAVLARFGTVEPAQLAAIVFAPGATGALGELNQILHPLIMARAWNQLHQWQQQGTKVAGIEATLLIEAGLLTGFDHVILVAADPEVRIQRFMRKAGASREQALARMAHQLPEERKLAQADIVISNKGTLAALAAEVGRLWNRFLAEANA
ncbi:MAG: dephospho-CoA kinase [Acidobacteria bacterium]|nr:MAG: dephospho-CoA kinase [Acidobacteriota bacterium]